MIKYGVFAALLFLLFIILFLNRSHPKAQETLIVVVATLLIAVSIVYQVSSVPSKLEKEIYTLYFFSDKEKSPFFISNSVLSEYHSEQISINNRCVIQNKHKQLINWKEYQMHFCNLQAATVMGYLMDYYHKSWMMKHTKERFPGDFTLMKARCLDKKGDDASIYKETDLDKIFSENPFYPYITTNPRQLLLPKGTKIIYTPYTDKQKYCEIKLIKPYRFNITIKLFFISFGNGISNMVNFTDYDVNEWEGKYSTIIIEMKCVAKFNRFLLYNPKTLEYREWITNLLDDLYNRFSWQVCEQNIKNHIEFTAHQRIIRNFK